jgi:hypothetical protein
MVTMKAPSNQSRHGGTPEKLQTLSSNLFGGRMAGFERLELLWMLELGIWNF